VTLDTQQVLLEGAQMLDEQERAGSLAEARPVGGGASLGERDTQVAPPRPSGESQHQPTSPRPQATGGVSGTHPSTNLYLWALSADSTLVATLGESLVADEIIVVSSRRRRRPSGPPRPGGACFSWTCAG